MSPRIAVPVTVTDRRWVDHAGVDHGWNPPAGSRGKWETFYAATCKVPECGWTKTGFPRAAIDDEARWHRQAHRRALDGE